MLELVLDGANTRTGALEAGRQCALTGPVRLLSMESCRTLRTLLDEKKPLPFEIRGAVIALCAASVSEDGETVNAFAPWPSEPESELCEQLIRSGAAAIIGSGRKSRGFYEALGKTKAVYLCPTGGTGALYAGSVSGISGEGVQQTAVLRGLPVIVAVDSRGKNIFN